MFKDFSYLLAKAPYFFNHYCCTFWKVLFNNGHKTDKNLIPLAFLISCFLKSYFIFAHYFSMNLLAFVSSVRMPNMTMIIVKLLLLINKIFTQTLDTAWHQITDCTSSCRLPIQLFCETSDQQILNFFHCITPWCYICHMYMAVGEGRGESGVSHHALISLYAPLCVLAYGDKWLSEDSLQNLHYVLGWLVYFISF